MRSCGILSADENREARAGHPWADARPFAGSLEPGAGETGRWEDERDRARTSGTVPGASRSYTDRVTADHDGDGGPSPPRTDPDGRRDEAQGRGVESPSTWSPPRSDRSLGGSSRLRTFGLWLAVVLGIGLLFFTYHHLEAVAASEGPPPAKALISELTAAFGAGVLFWGVRALALAMPLTARTWLRRLPLYVGALGLYSAAHTSSNWALRSLLYPLADLGPYDYGRMPVRYFMELPIDVLSFVLMVGVVRWAASRRRARERELREARLERSLTEAKLANLRLQLQPHFLFNALNTISSTMYRDVGRADELVERLGDLLRASLSTARDDLVPLGRELDWLAAYVELLEARFEERLRVEVDVPDKLRRAAVPTMLLQPLVENAVRHGGVESRGTGRIRISGRREDGSLVLAVADDGPGAQEPVDPRRAGFGLRSVAERLELLYGPEQALELASIPEGGFTATLRFPYRDTEPPS